MINNAYQKALLQESRIQAMQVMKMALEDFKETGNEVFWEWAKVFGEWSKLYRKQLEELSTDRA
jgi:hypothetical protein